jgi:hypothetical protein
MADLQKTPKVQVCKEDADMLIQTKKHYKIHIFTFAILSFCFLFYLPAAFINKLVAAAICIIILLNIKSLKFEFSQWQETILFIVINTYLTFAFFGYDLFLVNSFYLRDNLIIFFVYALSFIWTGYVLQSALNLMKYLSGQVKTADTSSNKKYWEKWLILFAIMCSVFMVWQRAFNPVAMSADSWSYIAGWRTGTYYSYFSPVYAFLIYIICSIAPSTPEVQWVAFAQIIAFSSLLATLLMYFHTKWISFRWLIPVSIILPLIPSLGLHTIVIWSDLACGMSIMWLTYVLVRVFDEVIIHETASKKQQFSFFIQLCISLIFCFFIRKNSFLVYLIMVPVLALLFLFKKNWKLLATVLISVIMVLIINLFGYKALNVVGATFTTQFRYFALIHDIQATYYCGGNLSEQTQNALMKYIPKLDEPEVRDGFIPDDAVAYDLSELAIGEFISMYADSFIHNPFKMIKSMLYRCRAYWVIDTKGDIGCVNYVNIRDNPGTTSSAYDEIGIYRHENILTRIMGYYLFLMNTSIPAIFVWRFGFWVALMIISMMTLILQKKFIWLLAYLPVFTYLVTLLLAMGWTDYRYGLPVFFVGMFLPAVFILFNQAGTSTSTINEDTV